MLIFMGLAIVSSHRRQPGSMGPFEEVIYGVLRPVQSGLSKGLDGIKGFWDGYLGLVAAQRENRSLRERIWELEQQLTEYHEIKASNERLRRLLDFQSGSKLRTLAAEVIGEDSTGWFHLLVIDKGLAHGVTRGMPVVVPEGVVGQTIECAERSSKVMLITDRNSGVDVMIQRTRARGVLEGLGRKGLCALKYVARTEEVVEGDRVITSGLGGVYPKGLLVGAVTSVSREGYGLFQQVEVSPQVDFDRLEEVMVLLEEGAAGGRAQ